MLTFEQYNQWRTTELRDLTSPRTHSLLLEEKEQEKPRERNPADHIDPVMKLDARSEEDHAHTQGALAVQTFDIHIVEAECLLRG